MNFHDCPARLLDAYGTLRVITISRDLIYPDRSPLLQLRRIQRESQNLTENALGKPTESARINMVVVVGMVIDYGRPRIGLVAPHSVVFHIFMKLGLWRNGYITHHSGLHSFAASVGA